MNVARKTLLIADDDPELRNLLVKRLGGAYEVVEAVDGLDALAQARRWKPDVLVLDIMMPFKSGWEVARDLRADPELAATKILVLTAIGETISDATSPLFADDHVDKPFDFRELELKIARLLAPPAKPKPPVKAKAPAKGGARAAKRKVAAKAARPAKRKAAAKRSAMRR